MSVPCARCKKQVFYFTLTLWNGPRGFRRYPLCDNCIKEVKAEKSPIKRKAVERPARSQ